jgi:excisionase family DNA binding protein
MPSRFYPLTVKEAAARAGVSERRIRALIEAGKLPKTKIADVYVIDSKDLAKITFHGKAGRPRKK